MDRGKTESSICHKYQSIFLNLKKSSRDPSFPRLGQMIVDYEIPMKKLSDDFVPHSKVSFCEPT